jgi:hypothetical protein
MLEGRAARLAQPMASVMDLTVSSCFVAESRGLGLYSEVGCSDSGGGGGGGGGAKVVVTEGLNAFLLVAVLRCRCDWHLEEHLKPNCLLGSHRTVIDGLSTDAREPCERRSASAARRSSIDLFWGQDMKVRVCEGDATYIG